MVIVKPTTKLQANLSTVNLHSSMVIVKPVKIRINDIKNNNLHSSMVIVKLKCITTF